MKKLTLIFILLLVVGWLHAQTITRLEYFFDTDPGIGGGIPQVIGSPDVQLQDYTFTIPVNSLSDGFHRLFLRARDSDGKWSVAYQRPIFKQVFPPLENPYTLSRLEYFIDADPGIGAGTPISVSQIENVQDVVFPVAIGSFPDGFHRLSLRALDSKGSWSIVVSKPFYKYTFVETVEKNITRVEYYFDSDPGIGSGNPMTFTPGQNIEVVQEINLSGLSSGFHKMYVRAMDQSGSYSVAHRATFFSDVIPNTNELNITAGEYFIDTDPGLGGGITIPFSTTPNLVDQVFTIDVSQMTQGFHKLFIRFKDQNQQWCHTMVRYFFVDTVLPFTLPNITYAEYFIDTDPGYGSGNQISNLPVGQIAENVLFTLDIDAIETGFHKLSIRAKDARNQWSPTIERSFYKGQEVAVIPTPISSIKYYITTNGALNYDLGTEIPAFEPNIQINNHEFIIELPTAAYPVGNYYLHAVAKGLDGKETHMAVDSFRVCDNVTIANFTYEVASRTVSFYENSPNATQWSWTFGDGYTSQERNPVHTYSSNDKYNVCLTVSNDCNTSVFCDSVEVVYNNAPTCANVPVQINENQTYTFSISVFPYYDLDSDPFNHILITEVSLPNIDSLLFNGQSVVENTQIPVSQLTNLKYKPAVNYSGYRGSFSFKVHDGTLYSTSTYSVTFTVNGINASPTYTLKTNPVIVVQNSGTTIIQNWVQDLDDGDPDENQMFHGSISVISGSSLFSSPPQLQEENTQLQFSIYNNVTGQARCQVSIYDQSQNQSPYYSQPTQTEFTIEVKQFKAQLAATPTQACTGQDVVFTSTSPRQGVVFNWNFGEGATPATYQGYEPGPVVYSTTGSKTAKLKITLGTQSDSANITLAVNTTPDASFLIGSEVFILTDTIYFYNTSTGGSTYEWNFGDGSPVVTSTNTNMVKHKYNAVDGSTYTPVLTARNGSCTDTYQKQITFIDALPPEILTTTFPASYDVNETVTASLTAQDPDNGLKKATFYYRSLSSNIWRTRNIDAVAGSSAFSTTITETMGDQVGIEYYFDVFNNLNIKKSSQHTYAYLKFNSGLPIPNIVAGITADKYQIIAIPLVLENSAVDVVLDEFPNHDPTQWRLFHYTPTRLLEYPADFQNFERGKGYWLITRNQLPVNTGAGATHSGTTFEEFRIPLRKGWTQIGNPYVYDIPWDEILAANPDAVSHIGALRVYNNGNFENSQTLLRFRGGFVFADDAGNELRIPVRPNTTKSFLLKTESEEDFSVNWKISMELTAKYIRNTDLGFGMHSEALASKDRFDVMATPRFLAFADATFHHPEYFYPNFATDIVPLSDSHIWDFTTETSFDGEIATLEWDNQKAQWLGNSLKLLDVQSLTLLDMKASNHYSFISNGKREFKILYGSQEFINNSLVLENTILGDCYPNPFEEKTIIPVYVQGDESGYSQVDISIYSIDGRKVATITKGTIRNGYHEFEWNSGNVRGFKTGIYLYTLNNFTDGTTQTKRMVVVK